MKPKAEHHQAARGKASSARRSLHAGPPGVPPVRSSQSATSSPPATKSPSTTIPHHAPRHTVPSINPAPSPPRLPSSFSISYLTPWPSARSQRSLCTWPHPAHLCCGGSRKGVSGLERSGEAETPFLKARRRATNHHRAGGQGVRLGVRLIDEHPKAAPRPRPGGRRREVVVAPLAQEASVRRAASADRAGRSIVTSRAGTHSRWSWPLRSGVSLGTRSIRQSRARIRSRVVNTMRSRPR